MLALASRVADEFQTKPFVERLTNSLILYRHFYPPVPAAQL